MKYLKYFISPATLVVALFFILKGAYYPTAFLIGFSLFGDPIMYLFKFASINMNPSFLNNLFKNLAKCILGCL